MASPMSVAAEPDIPTKCSVEMLVATSDIPMAHPPRLRPARKYPFAVPLRRAARSDTHITAPRNSAKTTRSVSESGMEDADGAAEGAMARRRMERRRGGGEGYGE